MRVIKGHGTENDFVVLPDPDAELDLTVDLVRRLCDRRAGVGADGVLRLVRTARMPGAGDQDGATYFMDYRNADGSVGQMCGNGIRVLARYLADAGLVEVADPVRIGTLAGPRTVRYEDDGDITVDMGVPTLLDARPEVRTRDGVVTTGRAVHNGVPHVVAQIADDELLARLDLAAAPIVSPPLPEGQNVEFVARLGSRHLAMRVHERGAGQTRSCGTGICAAVAASAPGGSGDGDWWRVDVPGGTCAVRWRPDGPMFLRGPAVLVARVELDPQWLTAAPRRPVGGYAVR